MKQTWIQYMKNLFILCWDLGGVQHMEVLTEDLHKRTTSLALGAPTYLATLYSQHSDITGFGWATESFTVHVPVLTDCSVSISIHFLTQILPHITTKSSQAVRHPTVHYVRRQTQEQHGKELPPVLSFDSAMPKFKMWSTATAIQRPVSNKSLLTSCICMKFNYLQWVTIPPDKH